MCEKINLIKKGNLVKNFIENVVKVNMKVVNNVIIKFGIKIKLLKTKLFKLNLFEVKLLLKLSCFIRVHLFL